MYIWAGFCINLNSNTSITTIKQIKKFKDLCLIREFVETL